MVLLLKGTEEECNAEYQRLTSEYETSGELKRRPVKEATYKKQKELDGQLQQNQHV